ncbi:MAG: ribonuclease P protein component [Pseudomonadales bacterium]|nr:ribonuclease P protein component [Pseudomonadales bacterium]
MAVRSSIADVPKVALSYLPEIHYLTNEVRLAAPDQGFPKKSRLLSSKDYTPVFENPDFRVSSRHFLLLARSSKHAGARLGIVVGKKNIAKAVQRNRLKRLIRESFRAKKQHFDTIDLIVLARKGLAELDKQTIRHQLDVLFSELLQKKRTVS